jgi:hypothetical protein
MTQSHQIWGSLWQAETRILIHYWLLQDLHKINSAQATGQAMQAYIFSQGLRCPSMILEVSLFVCKSQALRTAFSKIVRYPNIFHQSARDPACRK